MKKLRYLSILLAVVLAVCLVSGLTDTKAAETTIYTDEGNYTVTDGKATLIWVSYGVSGSFEIPAYVEGYPVTAIADKAVYQRENITEIVVPDTVTDIGSYAFWKMPNLTKVTMGDGVANIGHHAFYNCPALTTVVFGAGVESIGSAAFTGCDALYMVSISSVASWCKMSFASASENPLNGKNLYINGGYIKDLTIPETVTSIGDFAFAGCKSVQTVTIPYGMQSIGASAFNCPNLKTLNYNAANSTVASNTFSYAGSAQTGVSVHIGANVEKLPNYFVSSNAKVSDVSFAPNAICTEIGSMAFYKCSSLKSITLPNTVTGIGYASFYNSGLETVELPDSLVSIGEDAFFDCTALTAVTIPNSVETIGSKAFKWCTGLTAVTIGSNLTNVGDGLFYECTNLESVTIREGVAAIGSNMFYGCSKITYVIIPGSAATIGEKAFYLCQGLESVGLTYGVTTIGDEAFAQCSSLYAIMFPDSVTTIGDEAFYYCSGMHQVFMGTGVKQIGKNAFVSYPSVLEAVHINKLGAWCEIQFSNAQANPLTQGALLYLDNKTLSGKVVIPEGTTAIASAAFYNCKDITSVTIPASVTRIGEQAFYGCDKLKRANISDIGAWCGISGFDGQREYGECNYANPLDLGAALYLNGQLLTDAVIPGTVSRINDCAFAGCESLRSVIMEEGVTEIGIYAFYGCKNLSMVSVPGSMEDIEYAVFDNTKLTHLAYAGTATQWTNLFANLSYEPSFSYVNNFHYNTTLKSRTTCTEKGVYCPACSKMLVQEVIENGTHTYSATSDISCEKCDHVQSATGISIYRTPDVLTYLYIPNGGMQRPDVQGGIIAISYDDGGLVYCDMTYEMVSYVDTSALGTQTLKVAYEGFETSYAVEVAEKRPVAIYIFESEMNLNYSTGQQVCFDGLNLAVEYEDGIDFVHGTDARVHCSNVDTSTAGAKVVQVEYLGCYTEFTVYVHEYEYTAIGSSQIPQDRKPTKDAPVAFSFPGATSITVVFDLKCTVADDEYLMVYDADDTLVAYYVDDYVSGHNLTIPGDGFLIYYEDGSGVIESQLYIASITANKAKHNFENGSCTICGDRDPNAAIGGTCGENLTWTVAHGVLTISGNGAMPDFEYNEAPWLEFNGDITKIVINEGVTTIGACAFYEMRCLTEVSIPDSVTEIHDYAFGFNDESAFSIRIPANATIADYALHYCYALTGIWVDEANTLYSSDAYGVLFSKDKTQLMKAPSVLTKYTIPNGVESILYDSFSNCTALTEVTIPDSVTTIEYAAFWNCYALKTVDIPAGVTYIDSEAFEYCYALTGFRVDSNNTAYSSDSSGVLFNKNKTKLIKAPTTLSGSYVIPNGVVTICASAFSSCGNLTGVTLPKTVTTIEDLAFYNCTNLTAIEFPAAISSIGSWVFCECWNLTQIKFNGKVPVFGENVFGDVTATATYPANDDTWTEDVLQSYGGDISWEEASGVSGPEIGGGNDGPGNLGGDAAEKFDIDVARMILGNALEFQFGVAATKIPDTTGYYAVIEKEWADGTTTTKTIPATEWGVAGQYWAVVYDGLAAKEMGDTFYVTIYNADGVAVSNAKQDAVRDYVERAFASQKEAGKTMMVDMLNYGAAAQVYTDYGTDDLANSKLTDAQKAYGTAETPEMINGLVKGTNYNGTRFILESRIQVQLAFKNLTSDMYAIYTYTSAKGEAKTVRVEGADFVVIGGKPAGVELSQLVYADARTMVEVTVYKADGTVHGTATDSIESCCVRSSGGGDLFIALMKFADSAKAYL